MFAFLIIITVICLIFAIVFYVTSWDAEKFYREQKREQEQHDRLLDNPEWCKANPDLYKKYLGDKRVRDYKKEVQEGKKGPAVSVYVKHGHYHRTLYSEEFYTNYADSAGGWDITCNIRNIAKQGTVNYVIIYITPYDRVGNPCGEKKSFRFVGPLREGFSSGNVRFEHCWYDIPINSLKINRIEVEFEHGKKQIIENNLVVRV